jgi:hypothetical protein
LRQTRPLLARPVPAFLIVLAVFVAGSALAWCVARRYQDRLHRATGPASWIWLTDEVGEEPAPLRFFAAREFDWHGSASRPAQVLLFVDRRYALFFNGAPVGQGRQRPGDPLDAYDLSGLLRRGRNRIVIGAESPDGAGGILFLLTLPDGTQLSSDGRWRVAKTEKELESGGRQAAVWGSPPMYPWGYPRLRGGI